MSLGLTPPLPSISQPHYGDSYEFSRQSEEGETESAADQASEGAVPHCGEAFVGLESEQSAILEAPCARGWFVGAAEQPPLDD